MTIDSPMSAESTAQDLVAAFKMLADLKKQINKKNAELKETPEWQDLKDLRKEFKDLKEGVIDGARKLVKDVTGTAPAGSEEEIEDEE